MELKDFKYEEEDIISDTIINYCKTIDKEEIKNFINRYINDNKFYEYIQKSFLVNRINEQYLLRLYNDYEENNIVDEYDYITSISTTRWI